MKLKHDLHLAYCTNIHRGETWAETRASLEKFTLPVRERVCPNAPYAIGLRLSDLASRELSDPTVLLEFQRWLSRHDLYVFSINGFPYGHFHGRRVKEQVYRPDWTSPDRVNYTNRLFDLLAQLVPEGIQGSVSTAPGSFKEFINTGEERRLIAANIFESVAHIANLSKKSGRRLHLGLEPEPLCLLETTAETVDFFESLRARYSNDSRLTEFLGVNYDACHLAVEFEDPLVALSQLRAAEIKVSKLHLSSALKVRATRENRAHLAAFADDIYLHQVVAHDAAGKLTRFKDLDVALADPKSGEGEWRVHFHIPLHAPGGGWFDNTTDHLLGVLDMLQADPRMCSHLEMETYTWDVMPPELKSRNVVEQLASEYDWCLGQLKGRGLA